MHSIKTKSPDLWIAGDRCHFEVIRTHKRFAAGIYITKIPKNIIQEWQLTLISNL